MTLARAGHVFQRKMAPARHARAVFHKGNGPILEGKDDPLPAPPPQGHVFQKKKPQIQKENDSRHNMAFPRHFRARLSEELPNSEGQCPSNVTMGCYAEGNWPTIRRTIPLFLTPFSSFHRFLVFSRFVSPALE
jgi:hypothetical protein